jgi:hypothetical protein
VTPDDVELPPPLRSDRENDDTGITLSGWKARVENVVSSTHTFPENQII